MNTFNQWFTALTTKNTYAVETDVLALLQWLWRDYCDATFQKAAPSLTLPDDYLDAKVTSLWNAQPDAGLAKKKRTAGELDAFSIILIEKYKKAKIPDKDDDTLCIYHAFSNVSGVPDQQRSALVLCNLWKNERFVADLAYDDDRCVRLLAVKYGFKKWSPLKGEEILANYKTPGTELIISILQNVSKIPATYWTDGAWHTKLFDIENNKTLESFVSDPGTYGHAVYAMVERNNLIKFYDNKNNNGKATTQIQTNAKPLRCIVYSKPPENG